MTLTDPTRIAPLEEPQFEDLGKDSDYLEDLARILENLLGFGTLAQELIQNAEDATATTMVFDVCQDGLIVDNSAAFSDCGDQHATRCPWGVGGHRPCDLHAFRRLSGATKRADSSTIGAFGIGFTAVYQVTDRPELLSAGQHIVLDETLEPKQRARRCLSVLCALDHAHPGTRFLFPWARDPKSELRASLRAPVVGADVVTAMLDALHTTVPRAMLFLQHLKTVEIRREGQVEARWKREHSGGHTTITDGSTERCYLMLERDFADASAALRGEYPNRLRGRVPIVRVAIPLDWPSEPGRLFAGLPTADETGFPFHVNAPFFPADDRRSLRWNATPHADWNALALTVAGQAVAANVLAWRDAVDPVLFWSQLAQAASAVPRLPRDPRERALAELWRTAVLALGRSPIVWTAQRRWELPADGRLSPDADNALLGDVLAQLDIRLADASVASLVRRARMDLTVADVSLDDLLTALERRLGDIRFASPDELPVPLGDADTRDLVLTQLEHLRGVGPDGTADERVAALVLAPTRRGTVAAFGDLLDLAPSEARLFELLDPTLASLDAEALPEEARGLRRLASPLTCSAAAGRIAQACGAGSDAVPAVVLNALIRWLARHHDEIARDDALRDDVRALPIWPTGSGRTTLEGLSLPSGREDSLPLADVVDLEQLKDVRAFLERSLKLRPLSLSTYCRDVLPQRLGGHGVTTRDRRAVVRTLGRIKSDIISDEQSKDALRRLPLVECTDGEWRSVATTYAQTAELDALLGSGYHAAVFAGPDGALVRDVLTWLGLDSVPRERDLVARLTHLSDAPAVIDSARTIVHRVLDYLAATPADWSEEFITELRSLAWMTADGDAGWHMPPALYQRERRRLFASQAKFHDAPREREKTELLRRLGLDTQPPAKLVVAHLLHQAAREDAASWEAYEFLDSHVGETDLSPLRSNPSILLENGGYARPDHVFQSKHPFGSRRAFLPARLRGHTRLLTALGVADEPNARDALQVLLEVATTEQVSPEERATVHACWQLLQVNTPSVVSGADLQALANERVVLDQSGRLRAPRELLFDDAPSLAARLGPRVADRLITRAEDTRHALEDAGVRNLSEAVDVEIVSVGAPSEATIVADRMLRRAALLGRVVDAWHPGAAPATRALATRIAVDCSDELAVRYELDGDDGAGALYRIRALYQPDTETLCVAVPDARVPWLDVARELARALAPDAQTHWIAPSLRVTLEASSPAEAAAELDALEVPRLEGETDSEAWTEAPLRCGVEGSSDEGSADEFDDDMLRLAMQGASRADAVSDAAEEVAPSPSERPRSQADACEEAMADDAQSAAEYALADETVGRDADTGGRPRRSVLGRREDAEPAHEDDADVSDSGATPARRRTATSPRRTVNDRTPGAPLADHYLETFAIVTPRRAGTTATREELHVTAVDNAGMRAVMTFEREAGREPLRKPHSHPGYDIESWSDDEIERIIEVKSLDGPWDAARVRLSNAQFEAGIEHGEQYWLYVVENARTSSPTVWAIRDPAGRVDRFGYVADWKRLAEGGTDRAGEEAA